MLPIDNDYNYSCILGNGKRVKFRPWKTKDEKSFLTFSETNDDVTDEDFFRLLISPCMEEPTLYLSDADIQMLLIEIRKASMGEDFTMKYICSNDECKTLNEADITFDSIVKYRKDTVKEFESEDGSLKVIFGEIKNVSFFKDKIKDASDVEKAFIELVLRIEKITLKGTDYDGFQFDECYAFIDNLDVKVFDKLMDYFNKNKSHIDMESSLYCMSCNSENAFIFDEIPNFLEGW